MNLPAKAAIAWLIVAMLLFPGLRRLDASLRPTSPVSGTQSALVEARLAESFDSPFATTAILVMTGIPPIGSDTAAWRAQVRRIVTPIGTLPGVTGLVSPASSLDTLLASRDGSTAIAIVGVTGPALIDSLRRLTVRNLPMWRLISPTLTLQWTGQPALIEDLRVSGVQAARQAEWRAIPVMVIVALWALGAAGTAFALVAAAFAIAVTLGAVGSFGALFPPALIIRLLVPLVGLALTVDYSLYLVHRERDGVPRREARRTVLLAAAVVAVGFAALSIAPTGELRAAARAGVLVSLLSALAAVTFTSYARAPKVPRARAADARWIAWGRRVVARPWTVIAATAIPLALLAWHARSARLVTPLTNWLPVAMESTDAVRSLERAGRVGIVGALRVLVTFPADTRALSDSGWATLRRETAALGAMPGVAVARSLTSIGTGDLIVAQHVLPPAVIRSYLSRDERTAIIDVIPDVTLGESAATDLVLRLRAQDRGLLVGGLPAYVVDYAAAIRRALPFIIGATTLATLIMLAAVLRAPLLAIKAVTLNLLVAAAAIGATVFVYQDGIGLALLGHAPIGAVLPTIPVLAFGAVFGLSMDYELFLLSGVLEAKQQGDSDANAIVAGLARTAPLITRAAAIMITVFLAFAVSAFVPVAMVGFALAVAVFLDATVVRLALAPAILQVAGRWNWWPGGGARR
jgi:RND superfamily putative drug exporter